MIIYNIFPTWNKINNLEPETIIFSISKILNKIFQTISRNTILISKLRDSKIPRTLELQYSRHFLRRR